MYYLAGVRVRVGCPRLSCVTLKQATELTRAILAEGDICQIGGVSNAALPSCWLAGWLTGWLADWLAGSGRQTQTARSPWVSTHYSLQRLDPERSAEIAEIQIRDRLSCDCAMRQSFRSHLNHRLLCKCDLGLLTRRNDVGADAVDAVDFSPNLFHKCV